MSPAKLYGQCRCGATLTADHLQNHCPLRPAKEMSPEDKELLEDICALARRSEGFAYQQWMISRVDHCVGSLLDWPISLRLWEELQRRGR